LPAPGVREDTGVVEGARVTPDYDPLVSKIIAWGEDRPQAIARLKGYLMDSTTLGIRTTAGFFLDLLDHPEFRAGRMTTAFLEDFPEVLAGAITQEQRDLAAVAAALIATYRAQNRRVQMGASTSGWQNSGRRQATSRSTLLRG